MAYLGTLMFLVAALGAFLYWRGAARADALVPVDRRRDDRAAVRRRARGLGADRGRAPAVDRAGPAAGPRTRSSPSVGTSTVGVEPRRLRSASTSRSASSTSCSCAATRGPTRPGGARRRAARAGGERLMTLEMLWFVPDRGPLGRLLRARGLRLRRRHAAAVPRRATSASASTLLASIGPVWDGNEVWLVVAAGATFAAFPAWYATMFSGFYLALLLDPRAADRARASRSSGASGARARAGAASGAGRTRSASVGAPFLWGVALASLLDGVPLDGDGDFTGDLADLFSLYTVARRHRRRRAVRVPRRDVPHPAHDRRALRARGRAARGGSPSRRRSLAARLRSPGPSRSPSTATTATSSRRCSRRRSAVAALVLAVAASCARGGSGWAFAVTAAGDRRSSSRRCSRALYPRVLVSRAGLRQQPHDRRRGVVALRARGDHRGRAGVVTPVVLLYQGWTYHVLPAPPGRRRAAVAARGARARAGGAA